jgi:Ca-activated chloride channel homolog
MGATAGGAQDIGYFRTTIEAGSVPRSDGLTVEGMLSEHDLPLTSQAPCTEALCLSSAVSVGRGADDDRTSGWVQLGLSSSFDTEHFTRADLDLAVVVDRSGSMAEAGKMQAVRDALHTLVKKLTPRDRVSIVLFDDTVDLLVAPTAVADVAVLDQKIDTIQERGATDIELGLERGFEILANDQAPANLSKRVMLLTDALPNTGATSARSFVGLATKYAEQGIGLTAFGVGLDFGVQLADQISHVRGGAYFYLESPAKVSKVFDRDFDLMVTPIAYDLKIDVSGSNWKLAGAYGVPGYKSLAETATIDVASVFLSRNRGGIVLRFAPPADAVNDDRVAHLTMHYSRPDGSAADAELDARYTGAIPVPEGTSFHEQPGVHKALALTNWVLGVKRALTLHEHGNSPGGRQLLEATRAAFAAEAAALSDPALNREIALLDKLIALVR